MKTISRELGKRMWGGGGTVVGSGSSEGGGESGVSAAWVNQNFLTNEFFNQLFVVHINTRVLVEDTSTTPATVISDTTTAGTLLPNDLIPSESTIETDPETGYVTTTTITLASIEATTNFWSSLAISALGQGSGGGGGGATALSQLVDVQLSNLQNGQALVYDSTLEKWVNANVQGGSTAWADITGKPTTIAGYGITDAKIVSGTITLGADSITPLTSSDISDMATQTWVGQQGYATQSWVNQKGFLTSVSGTFWGNSWSNGGTLSGHIIIDNGYAIRFMNRSGDNKNVLTLNSSNQLAIGFNTRQMGYVTDIQGDPITFATNNGTTGGTDNRLEVGEFSSAGRFWVKQGTQGLRIGNGLITWDSANNALKISDYNGNSANIYALGAVSALGFSSSGGTTSINSLTVNDSILVKDYAGNSKKALSVTLPDSSSGTSILTIGEGWKGYLHDTAIRGYNIRFETGQHDAAAVTINGAGLATFNYYLKSSRYYLDASRYLYLSGSNLYYYNGSTSIQIA